jgi:DNA-binding response OmpR family regulator
MNVLTELLTRHGYEVVPARNGVAAMVAFTAPEPESPHVVLLDLGIPLESGVSVLSFLRNVMGSGLPVVILTGLTDPEQEATARAMGVSDYLRKPASPQHILAAISAARASST